VFSISNLKYVLLILWLCSCQSEVHRLEITDEGLNFSNGIMLYKEKPYSGILFSKIDTVTTYSAMYQEGKKHGKEQKFFFKGDLAELSYYTKGIKSGTHRSWWNKEQMKFEYHFDTMGNKIGTQREWYSNGQLFKEFNYRNGQEDGTQKSWDITGKINVNYVVIAGERFGFIGSKNCNPFNYD